MARAPQTRGDTRRVVVSRLDGRSAQGDDGAVAQAIHAGTGSDALYNRDEAGLLDAFYHFQGPVGFLALIAEMRLPGVRRVLLPVLPFVPRYLRKTLYGIASLNALPPLLFSNVALMRLIGFNAHQVAPGRAGRDAAGGLAPPPAPQAGAALAAVPGREHLHAGFCTRGVEHVAALFNGTVRLLVARGVVQGDLTVALDGSTVLTPETYPGRGGLSVTRTATEAKTKRRVRSVETLFGWKVRVRIDVRTRLPLAMAVGQIQDYEGHMRGNGCSRWSVRHKRTWARRHASPRW